MLSNCKAKDEEIQKRVVVNVKPQPALGILVMNVSDEKLKELNLNGGAEVKKVMKNSEAEKIGLQKGDIITKFDGNDIAGPEDLREMIEGIEEKKTVEIVLNRERKEVKMNATLDSDEDHGEWVFSDWDKMVDWSEHLPGKYGHPRLHFNSDKGGFLGVEVTELSDQLSEYFEVNHGVLIEKVLKDSPAEKAGLKAGDVITEIEGRKINDYGDLTRTLNFYNPEEKIKLSYSRKGKKSYVDVTLEKKEEEKFFIGPGKHHTLFEYLNHSTIEKELKALERNMEKLGEELKNIEIVII
jgi:serine protease Do